MRRPYFDPGPQLMLMLAALLLTSYAVRFAYEIVRPVLPLVFIGGSLLIVWRLLAAWRRFHDTHW